jgi:hypothetical protein
MGINTKIAKNHLQGSSIDYHYCYKLSADLAKQYHTQAELTLFQPINYNFSHGNQIGLQLEQQKKYNHV